MHIIPMPTWMDGLACPEEQARIIKRRSAPSRMRARHDISTSSQSLRSDFHAASLDPIDVIWERCPNRIEHLSEVAERIHRPATGLELLI
jgi:hypothetical protein